MNQDKLVVSNTIFAPIQTVWSYYTEPNHIVNWNFASDDWCCPSAKNDLRVGGTYNARMEAKDGSFGFDFEAEYNLVVIPNRLGYTMPNGREVVVELMAKGEFTEIIVSFEPENEYPLEMQQEGWQAILNNFKLYTEKNTK